MVVSKHSKAKTGRKTASKTKRNSASIASAKRKRRIPPPPGPEASWEEQSEYFDKYGGVELEEAGYFTETDEEEKKICVEIAKSSKAKRLRLERETREMKIDLEPQQYFVLEKLAKRRRMSASTLAGYWLRERIWKEAQTDAHTNSKMAGQ